MCVIAVKPAGVEMLPEERLRDMFVANPDGAGFMYVRGGKVHIRKGFMKLKQFLKALAEEAVTKDELLITHCRIATAGSTSPQNTHPFPISDELKELRSLKFSTDLAMAHNGVLAYDHDKKNDLSDTMTFIKEVIAPKAVRDNLYEFSTLSLLEMAIGSSKMIFVDGEGNYQLLGNWYEDNDKKDGCSYSNLHFKYKYSGWGNERSYVVYPPANTDKKDDKKEKGSETTPPATIIRGHFSNIVALFDEDTVCPKCKTPIYDKKIPYCQKCGVMFERED